MLKIPTVYCRSYENSRRGRSVLPVVSEGCEWVLDGEGVATRKFEGICILLRGGQAYNRRAWKNGGNLPAGFEEIGYDKVTGKHVGWVLASKTDPRDKWLWEAMEGCVWKDGTYELCGPKVQGNPEGFNQHVLVAHGREKLMGVPRDFDGLRKWLVDSNFEGIVWWHPDGRMAKIKKRDFPK